MNKKVGFPNIATMYTGFKKEFKKVTVDRFYDDMMEAASMPNDDYGINDFFDTFWTEHLWYKSQQPYYKLYPSVLDAFMGTNCDVSVENIKIPHRCFVVKLPQKQVSFKLHDGMNSFDPLYLFVGCGLSYSTIEGFEKVASFIPGYFDSEHNYDNIFNFLRENDFINQKISLVPESIEQTITINVVAYDRNTNDTVRRPYTLTVNHGIEHEIQSVSQTDINFSQCLRIAFGVMFCATGSHKVLEYDVLKKHLDAYEKLKDGDRNKRKKYEALAKKKGKFGWCIGRDGRELNLPNGVSDCVKKGLGQRELSHSFIRGGHWRMQAYGYKRSKRKPVWIETTQVRPDLPLINYAA